MLTAKQLLLKQTAEAFSGRSDMPLMASLADITQAEASWSPDKDSPTAEQIVRHVAWAKARYCQQAFGSEMPIVDDSVNGEGDTADLPWEFPCGTAWGSSVAPGIHEAIKLLSQSHAILTQCLESLPDDALDQPLPTHHGKSAAHFFWIMIMHDLYHAGQIRTRRTAWRASQRDVAPSLVIRLDHGDIGLTYQPLELEGGQNPEMVRFKVECEIPHSTNGRIAYTTDDLWFFPRTFVEFADQLKDVLDGKTADAVLSPASSELVLTIIRVKREIQMQIAVSEWNPIFPPATISATGGLSIDVAYRWARELKEEYSQRLNEWILEQTFK